MEVGKRIYFDIETGNLIVDTGQRQGAVKPTTVDQDIQTYVSLSERNRESFDFVELDFGQNAQDFLECDGYRVNPITKELEFSYPDPDEPGAEQHYQRPLSEIVGENTDYLLDVDFRLIMVELGLY